MRLRLISVIGITIIFCVGIIYYSQPVFSSFIIKKESAAERRARFHWQRVKYDFDMMKDPVTGKIPKGIFEAQMLQARSIPEKDQLSITARTTNLNSYIPAGPNNIGGRTRALAYDVRYNGSGNKVLIAGSVSGGIMRSVDGGNNWVRASPENDIHNVTAVAQDPRSGFQDTWYAGGGETFGNSANEDGAPFYGQYMWKSTNNGVSWARLPLNTITDLPGNTSGTSLEAFDHPFDFIHQIAINPLNGDLYVSGHRRVLKSVNGGSSFQVVFASTVAANSSNGQSDVVVTNTGKVIIAMNGGTPDVSLRGVWTSNTGNLGSFTRIAGGSVLGVDSVANWRGNDPADVSRRIVMGLAPSNNNIIYILYENGLSSEPPNPKPEADLFKLDMAGGNNIWTNLSANMPDFSSGNLSGSDPFTVQGGYDMIVKVKPDNINMVFVGGTNLYRSTDGFTTPVTANKPTSDTWINGYSSNLTYTQYQNGHADMHHLVFNPSNPNEAISANDGGIQITSNITAAVVVWSMMRNYQTLQYYDVAIDPAGGTLNFIGGAQDNGTYFRNEDNNLNLANEQIRILGGDGTTAAIGPITASDFTLYASSQQGTLYRDITNDFQQITPAGITANPDGGFGDFVTNFLLDQDNFQDLYYVNYNRLFRTTTASTVTPTTWTELTGVSSLIDPSNGTNISIRGMAISRGPYATSHVLYLGTDNGRIYRLDNPRNAAASTTPVNITPPLLNGTVQDIAVNPNNDDEIIAVVSNYNTTSVWWTKNAKSASPTWKNAEGNLTLPSYRSCMIVVKKDASNNPVTEYYVGTSVGLYSVLNLGTTLTAGGTPTWQREGGTILNYAVVQSLSYRPVDNVLLVGTHGNGMYYTIIGSPNFTPNLNTGINDPVLNDKNFIRAVYPTITANNISFKTGNMFTIKKISIQLYNLSGQQIIKKETGYNDGSVDISRLSRGAYILSINSNDGKYRHIQKIIKN